MENIMNELENLLKDLYKISGLNMSIFDLNQNLLASYPHKKSKFCNELEKNNNAFQHCIDCDYKAMEHVKKTGELYKCHFGLNEAIMPLYSYGSLTGYLMMGQAVIGTYRNYSEILEKSKEYFQEKEILKKYITEITILNEEQVYAFANIYVQNTFHLQTVSKQNMIILPKKLNTISLQTTINKLQLKNYVLIFSVVVELYLIILNQNTIQQSINIFWIIV